MGTNGVFSRTSKAFSQAAIKNLGYWFLGVNFPDAISVGEILSIGSLNVQRMLGLIDLMGVKEPLIDFSLHNFSKLEIAQYFALPCSLITCMNWERHIQGKGSTDLLGAASQSMQERFTSMSWGAAAQGLQTATGVVTSIDAWGEFFNYVSSAISSTRSWIGIHQRPDNNYVHQIQEEMQCLQNDLWKLQTTLPKIRNLVERLEWQIYKKPAAELLPHIKDAVLDAEDIIDEFSYYELKSKIEGRIEQCQTLPGCQEFYASVIRGSFTRVKEIQAKLNHLHCQFIDLGLQSATQRFDKFVRPETSSFLNESKVFGREKEEKTVLELLGLSPEDSTGYKRKRSRVEVLPIVGLGGVGKTTLAQQICNNQRVKSHFDMILWACVSDDFNAKRLTKEVIQSSKKETSFDNLDSLQSILKDIVESKRFLLVLDDIWDDVMANGGQEWQRFCAPLSNAFHGSMILITTRSQKVADKVRTMDCFPLEGLDEVVFWEFFVVQAFGTEFMSYPELEDIGRNIILKLKGSPLAARTIGRLLRTNLDTTHWNNILHSELWKLEQERTDILPALRLSYMYLLPHLKKCFSFCAVYPKDYRFEKDTLVDIWLAEGFVEHAHSELVSRSFFQKASVTSNKYVIHDLMHDMAQLVSQDECFIVNKADDFQKIPPNVRHLSIFSKRYIGFRHLMALCKYKKLRTLLCSKAFEEKEFASVLDSWFKELQHIRVLSSSLPMTGDIPEGIGNIKLVGYLCFSSQHTFSTLPSSFCCLYNLQSLDASTCVFRSLPCEFGNLISLQKFRAKNFSYLPGEDLRIRFLGGERIKVLKHINKIQGNLLVNLPGVKSKRNIGLAVLKKENNIYSLQISPLAEDASNDQEQLEVYESLHPHLDLQHLEVTGYQGADFCPSWFLPTNLPNMTLLIFEECHNVKNISLSRSPCTAGFQSLTNLYIIECTNLSNIKQFLQPCHMPVIKMISIRGCQQLVSISAERFGGFHSLEVLVIRDCPRISWEDGLSLPPCLTSLSLVRCGDISKWIPDCLQNLSSLFQLQLVGLSGGTCIPGNIRMNNLPSLDYLEICNFQHLEFTGAREAIKNINNVLIDRCPKMKELKQPFSKGDVTFLWGIPTSNWYMS
uniref:NB-ARC domain-containing protein n=1 Tax=Oryza brachyantha TaxID=4533 RepID=J3NDI6_ORYBR